MVTNETVHGAESGLAGADVLKWDLLLLDIGLPRMSGYEVVQRIKAAHPAIFVVSLSGYGGPADRQRAAAAGFDAHLVKPVDFDHLRKLIESSASFAEPAILRLK